MAFFSRAKTPRGVRPELPAPVNTMVYSGPAQWGTQPMSYVADGQARGLPAFNYCLNLVANGVAQTTPMKLIASDGSTELPAPSVLTRPSAVMGCFDWFHSAVATTILHGNSVSLLCDFDASGYAQQLAQIPTGFTTIYLDGAGYLVYNIAGKAYSQDEVLHLRYYTVPGSPWGVGVVENHRRQIGASLDMQALSADAYKTGSVPSGIINLERPEVDRAQAEAVQAQWIEAHSGSRAPAVLPRTMTYTPLQWTPENAQWVEAKQLSIAETALMFGLNPSDVSGSVGGSSLVYQNVEQQSIERVVNAFGPMLRRLEDGFSDLVPGGARARTCPENLLRLDARTRSEVDQLDIASGVRTKDEARAARGLPALTAEQIAVAKPIVAPTPVPGTSIIDSPVSVKA